ncbi:hemolysin family protein [Chlamydia sp.]|uniref:hemolysin family protein n=1 Tax=Chlamydia sp. TaxID=35827 RepID=UPI0025BC6201|nr:hemolysin family protein [Chlamydia sp.]MBQ8498679.1 HlyC/CorC family transporter [Chlamydia sp.]
MLYILLAIIVLFLFFGSAISRRASALDGSDSPPLPSTFSSKILPLLCLTYGMLGAPIYRYFESIFSISFSVFWFIFLSFALVFYKILPLLIHYSESCIESRVKAFTTKILGKTGTGHTIPSSTTAQQLPPSVPSNELSTNISCLNNMIAREIMTPKADIFALQEETPISQAFTLIIEEGYSRVPLFTKSIDDITGMVLVKDLLPVYYQNPHSSQPLSSIAYPPLYTPEIRRVSLLLQEFRQKRRHLAIVVNEYGFTEGLVSMEDIIEEIFGEIADEYDDQEDVHYKKVGNAWIVDGRMNISDAEECLGLRIAHENSYDTLGGYVFHKLGAVPEKGMKIYDEDFSIDILSCSDRNVEKMKIIPRKRKHLL